MALFWGVILDLVSRQQIYPQIKYRVQSKRKFGAFKKENQNHIIYPENLHRLFGSGIQSIGRGRMSRLGSLTARESRELERDRRDKKAPPPQTQFWPEFLFQIEQVSPGIAKQFEFLSRGKAHFWEGDISSKLRD